MFKFVNNNYESTYGDHTYILGETNKDQKVTNLKDCYRHGFHFTSKKYINDFAIKNHKVFPYGNILLRIELPCDEALVIIENKTAFCSVVSPTLEGKVEFENETLVYSNNI